MNLGYFHTLLTDIKRDAETSNILPLVQQLVDNLQNQVNDPPNASHQTNVGNLRKQLEDALLSSPVNAYSESAKRILKESSLRLFIPSELLTEVRAAFSGNQITPQIALSSLQKIRQELEDRVGAINGILSGFSKLEVERDELEIGGTEVLISIPREFVHEDPIRLGEEFKKLDHIVRPFTELATGEYLPIRVRQISSSEFLIALVIVSNLDRAAKVVKAIAEAVQSLLGVYKNVSEIRVMKARLKEMDGDATKIPVDELEKFVKNRIDEGISKIAEDLVGKYYTLPNEGRKAEVLTHTKISLKRIAARIDKGFDFETRAGELPPPVMEENGDGGPKETSSSIALREALGEISNAHKGQLSFLREGEPILGLPAPDEENDGDPTA